MRRPLLLLTVAATGTLYMVLLRTLAANVNKRARARLTGLLVDAQGTL